MKGFPAEAWFQQIFEIIKPELATVAKVWQEFSQLRSLVAGMHDKYILKWSVLEHLDAKIQFTEKLVLGLKRKRGRPPLAFED